MVHGILEQSFRVGLVLGRGGMFLLGGDAGHREKGAKRSNTGYSCNGFTGNMTHWCRLLPSFTRILLTGPGGHGNDMSSSRVSLYSRFLSHFFVSFSYLWFG